MIHGLMNRRIVVGGVLIGATGLVRAAAAQDVLDPSILANRPPRDDGSRRDTPPRPDGLLDPAASVSRVDIASAPTRPADHYDPAYARGMNADIMRALIGVMHACAACANDAKSQIATCTALSNQLAAARRDKWAKLDEFRRGLFCSGCQQTKSEILAKGEAFPHPGQHIVAATPEQIAAKERELDVAINALSVRLDQANTAYKELDDKAAEAIEQLNYGMMLWRLTVDFERTLILQAGWDVCGPAERDAAKARDQIDRIKSALPPTPSPEQFAAATGNIALWYDIEVAAAERGRKAVDRCSASLDEALAFSRRARDAMVATGRQVMAEMTDFDRMTSVQNSVESVTGNGFMMTPPPSAHFEWFRMGDVSPARRGAVVPSVASLIARMHRTAGYPNRPQAPTVRPGKRQELDQWLAMRKPKPAPPLPAPPVS